MWSGDREFAFVTSLQGVLPLPVQVPPLETQCSRVLSLISEPFATPIYETTALKMSPFIFFSSDPTHPEILKMESIVDLVA